jgi:predicted KAP-like P-loop ATPase
MDKEMVKHQSPERGKNKQNERRKKSMAEMTASEAGFVLNKSGAILTNSIKRQIAALIERQQAEIAELKNQLHPKCHCSKCDPTSVEKYYREEDESEH